MKVSTKTETLNILLSWHVETKTEHVFYNPGLHDPFEEMGKTWARSLKGWQTHLGTGFKHSWRQWDVLLDLFRQFKSELDLFYNTVHRSLFRQQMLEFKTQHETFNPLHLYIPLLYFKVYKVYIINIKLVFFIFTILLLAKVYKLLVR
jgi:hypothetical protein